MERLLSMDDITYSIPLLEMEVTAQFPRTTPSPASTLSTLSGPVCRVRLLGFCSGQINSTLPSRPGHIMGHTMDLPMTQSCLTLIATVGGPFTVCFGPSLSPLLQLKMQPTSPLQLDFSNSLDGAFSGTNSATPPLLQACDPTLFPAGDTASLDPKLTLLQLSPPPRLATTSTLAETTSSFVAPPLGSSPPISQALQTVARASRSSQPDQNYRSSIHKAQLVFQKKFGLDTVAEFDKGKRGSTKILKRPLALALDKEDATIIAAACGGLDFPSTSSTALGHCSS